MHHSYGHTSTGIGQQIMPSAAGPFLGGSTIAQQTAAGYADKLAEPHGPLESAVDSVSRGVDEAFAALDRLAERLHPVLQPEFPTPVGANATDAPQPPRSVVTGRLQGLRTGLDALVCRINSISGRLDT